MKIKKYIIISFLVICGIVVGGVFFLRFEPVNTFLWKHSGSYEMDKACFAAMPYKCGFGYDSTEEEILLEISWLKISKEEARDLILKTMKEDSEELERLKNTESLTDFEKFRFERIPRVREYQERVLRVIEKME